MGQDLSKNAPVSKESLTELHKIVKDFNRTDEHVNIQESMLTMFFEFIKGDLFGILNKEDKEKIVFHFELTYGLIKDISKF